MVTAVTTVRYTTAGVPYTKTEISEHGILTEVIWKQIPEQEYLKLKNMDVLDIIKQLDALAADANKAAADCMTDQSPIECETARELKAYCQGQANAFEAFSAHLQEYIEAQLNAAECNTGE